MIPIFLAAWLIHACVAAVVVAPVLICTRKRVHWRSWELLSLIIPFCVWATSFFIACTYTNWKTLSNAAAEPEILGLALGVGAVARVALSTHISERRAALITLVGMCVVADAVFWIVPGLEE